VAAGLEGTDVGKVQGVTVKETYVSDLRVDQDVVDYFFVRECSNRQTKKGSWYLSMKLGDKTGQVESRYWDARQDEDYSRQFVKVQAKVVEYREELQLNITKIRALNPDEKPNIQDYFPRSKRDPEEMFQELGDLAAGEVDDPQYRSLLNRMMDLYGDNIKRAPGAKSVHHAYFGGLLEHTLSMARVAGPLADHYGINKSLLIAGCILHDIGKVREMTYTYEEGFGYSTEGTLLGHISLGMQMVANEARYLQDVYGESDDRGFDSRKRMELLHLIASHHGLLEFGSPKVPLMREAFLLHAIDGMDAKIALCNDAIASDRSKNEVTAWISTVGGPLLKPGVADEKEVAG
jgi:3'-5' exoribonuclease